MAQSNFEKAFAANRKAGKKEFSFGGKKYNTKLAPSKPKNIPVPADKPKPSTPMADSRPPKMSPTTRTKDDSAISPAKVITDRMPSDFTTSQKQSLPDASSGPLTRPKQLTDVVYPSEFTVKINAARARKNALDAKRS